MTAEGAVAAIEATGLHCRLGDTAVLSDVDLTVAVGEVVALVGPNGAGKSTLLGVLSGDVKPDRGRVELLGQPVASIATREQARLRSVLLQRIGVSFPFSAYEVVLMGRAPWAGTPQADDDERQVTSAMTRTDVTHLRDRSFTTLSGGEAGRVAIARILAQATPVMLLDEPTAALDIRHQEAVLTVAREAAGSDVATVVVLHDLNLACAYADRVVVLDRGTVAADGPPEDVCTAELLTAVYQHPIDVVPHPLTGRPLVLPRR